MRTVTAQLPDELAEGRSKAWLIRQAVADFLVKQEDLDRRTLEGLEAARSGAALQPLEAE